MNPNPQPILIKNPNPVLVYQLGWSGDTHTRWWDINAWSYMFALADY